MDKVLKTSFAQKSFLLTHPNNSATRFERLKGTNKKVARQNRGLAEREKVLGVAPDADDGLGAKVVLPHVHEEPDDPIGDHEKGQSRRPTGKVEIRQIEKRSSGLAKWKTKSYG